MKKVIIIGAGPAGITAANELLKDTKGEYDVTILEETERIGGISQRYSTTATAWTSAVTAFSQRATR